MERRVTFQFEFGVSRRTLIGALAVLFVFSTVGDLASESVTLTTYYPAPSGVYTQMITTGSTWLARDSGAVMVGSTNSPKSELDVGGASGNVSMGTYAGSVAAPTDSLILGGTPNTSFAASGKLGINTSAPGYPVEVTDDNTTPGNSNIDMYVHGRIMTGDGNNAGGMWLDSAQNMFVGQNGANAAGIYVGGYGWALNVKESDGYVGVLNGAPSYPLDVTGMGHFSTHVLAGGSVISQQSGCWAVTFMDGNVVCNGSYATLISGFYANYVAMGTEASVTGSSESGSNQGGNRATMTALCCPFPGGAYF